MPITNLEVRLGATGPPGEPSHASQATKATKATAGANSIALPVLSRISASLTTVTLHR